MYCIIKSIDTIKQKIPNNTYKLFKKRNITSNKTWVTSWLNIKLISSFEMSTNNIYSLPFLI